MMFEPSNTLINELVTYDINPDAAGIYLYIRQNGPSAALKISKDLHVDRTKVYRLLDKLTEKGLISQKMGERGFVFVAEPAEKFKLLITEKETELASLKERLPVLMEQLNNIPPDSEKGSKVLYYQGTKGLKQVTWNSLKAQKTLRIMEVASDMSVFLDQKFSEEVRSELVKRRIHTKQLTNITKIPNYTKVRELVKNYWEVRYLNPKKLKIGFETLIYNDTVALYNIRGKDVFCVEIRDKRLAETQKDLFDFIWKSAHKMKIIGENGEAGLQ
jgi:sugar-specific transcriptional regulator TrmB